MRTVTRIFLLFSSNFFKCISYFHSLKENKIYVKKQTNNNTGEETKMLFKNPHVCGARCECSKYKKKNLFIINQHNIYIQLPHFELTQHLMQLQII